jgi:hypothetical protein
MDGWIDGWTDGWRAVKVDEKMQLQFEKIQNLQNF